MASTRSSLELYAGDELDHEIAVWIMGYRLVKDNLDQTWWEYRNEHGSVVHDMEGMWRPSRNDAQALLVLKRLHASNRFQRIQVALDIHGHWQVQLTLTDHARASRSEEALGPGPWIIVERESFGHALCLAALEAVRRGEVIHAG